MRVLLGRRGHFAFVFADVKCPRLPGPGCGLRRMPGMPGYLGLDRQAPWPRPAALPASASTGIPGIPGIQGSPPPRPLTPGAPCGRNNDPEVPPVLGQDRPGPASLHQKRTRGPWVRFFGSEFRSTPQRGPSGAGSRPVPAYVSRHSEHRCSPPPDPGRRGHFTSAKTAAKCPRLPCPPDKTPVTYGRPQRWPRGAFLLECDGDRRACSAGWQACASTGMRLMPGSRGQPVRFSPRAGRAGSESRK